MWAVYEVTASHYVISAGLKLSLVSKFWDQSYVPLYLACGHIFLFSNLKILPTPVSTNHS